MSVLPKLCNALGAADASSDVRIVNNKLLGGWYVVRGSSDTPISGRFSSKEAAQQWLIDNKNKRDGAKDAMDASDFKNGQEVKVIARGPNAGKKGRVLHVHPDGTVSVGNGIGRVKADDLIQV